MRGSRPSRRWPRWTVWTIAILALALATLALLAVRPRLDKVHVVLVYLLLVLGGSAAGGRALGLVLSVTSFLAFNLFFLPPYNTLVIADPLDWLVLVAYLATGIVAAQLLYRAQREALVARERATEVDRLAALGAETLGSARADTALDAIGRVIRSTLGVATCEIYTWDPAAPALRLASASATPTDDLAPSADGAFPVAGEVGGRRDAPDLVRWVAANGRAATELVDGTVRVAPPAAHLHPPAPAPAEGGGVRALLIPLVVRERTVGVLRISDERPLAVDPTRQRYLDALAYYAALGVERVRLSAEAEHAEALREADRLKDSLLATVSHDIRTPLTTIRALAHEMADSGDERALVIEEEVGRLNRFVTDLLDLSRLSAGGMPLQMALCAAEDLIGAVLQRVGGMAAGREIRVLVDTSEPILVGRFDFAHSLRILTNLLENALKYSPASTTIEFAVRRDGDMLAFTVTDSGAGVPPHERERIFEPFHRAPGTAPDRDGAGLGLAIARGLAMAQGGELTCEPRESGESGSVFTLRLPAADLSEAALDTDTGDGRVPES